MAIVRTHLVCPYTLTPLSEIESVNDEHIFPDAIGGLKDYKVRVSSKFNSDLGSKIDAPLTNFFTIMLSRVNYDIKSRSGPPVLKLTNAKANTGESVNMSISAEGRPEIIFKKPVTLNDDGQSGRLTTTRENYDEDLRKLREGFARKGKRLEIKSEVVTKIDHFKAEIEVDFTKLKRAMVKIAYIACYEYLGDIFLQDPLISEWHKAFNPYDLQETVNAKIYGSVGECKNIMDLAIPPIESYQHAICVARFIDHVYVIVTLFGKNMHSILIKASESSTFGLEEGDGKIAVCDPKKGCTIFMTLEDHLRNMRK